MKRKKHKLSKKTLQTFHFYVLFASILSLFLGAFLGFSVAQTGSSHVANEITAGKFTGKFQIDELGIGKPARSNSKLDVLGNIFLDTQDSPLYLNQISTKDVRIAEGGGNTYIGKPSAYKTLTVYGDLVMPGGQGQARINTLQVTNLDSYAGLQITGPQGTGKIRFQVSGTEQTSAGYTGCFTEQGGVTATCSKGTMVSGGCRCRGGTLEYSYPTSNGWACRCSGTVERSYVRCCEKK